MPKAMIRRGTTIASDIPTVSSRRPSQTLHLFAGCLHAPTAVAFPECSEPTVSSPKPNKICGKRDTPLALDIAAGSIRCCAVCTPAAQSRNVISPVAASLWPPALPPEERGHVFLGALEHPPPLPVRLAPRGRLDLHLIAALPGAVRRGAALRDDALELQALARPGEAPAASYYP
jgi:hypothetical protein